jgi:hypothetical protein
MSSSVLSVACALVLAAIVLPHAIREGLIVKIGLVAMIFGLLAGAGLTLAGEDSAVAHARAAFTLHAGIAVVCVGLMVKARRIGQRRRAAGTCWHAQRTNQLLHQITEPVRDLAFLFEPDERVDRPAAEQVRR